MFTLLTAQTSQLTAAHFDQLLEKLLDLSITAGKHILAAAVVFFLGRIVVRFLNNLFAKMLSRRKIDVGVQSFLRSAVNILLTVLLVVSVIGALGISTTSFAALLASAGVAIGMALSGNLQNFAGGLIILLFKPYKVGDWIEAQGVQGRVTEIQIFHTILTMVDNKVVYIPNGSMSTAVVINYTRNETRRVEWTIGVDYGEDVERVRAAIRGVVDADARILVVSYIGMKTQEIRIPRTRNRVNVIMQPDNLLLQEVVVTGYGNFTKSSFTGSANTLRADMMKDVPVMSVEQKLQGTGDSQRLRRFLQLGCRLPPHAERRPATRLALRGLGQLCHRSRHGITHGLRRRPDRQLCLPPLHGLHGLAQGTPAHRHPAKL